MTQRQDTQRTPRAAYYSLFLLGVLAISSQIILIRELFTNFYGNELSIGFILALWLLGGAAGSGILGNFLVDKIRKKIFVFSVIQIAASILMPLGIMIARISRFVFHVDMGEIVGLPVFLISSGALLFPLAALFGFLYVLGCKIFTRRSAPLAISRVYTLEALGAMVGGVATSLVLIRWFGSLHIAFMLSCLGLSSSYLIVQKCKARYELYAKYISLVLFCVISLCAVFGGVGRLDKKTQELKWQGFNVLASRDSIYGRTTVTESSDQYNFFNNGLFLFSTSDAMTAEEMVHFPFSFSVNPQRILLVGGGASDMMNEILKYPVTAVDYVELNPLIISFAKEFLSAKPFYRLADPRVRIINTDGRAFIKNTPQRYDVAIINLPNPYTAQINRFYTEEFFKELRRVLADSAIVAFGVTSSENYLSKEQALFLKTLFKTAREAFEEVKIIPGDTAYFLLSPKKGAISVDERVITDALASRGIATAYVRDYYLFSKLSHERLGYLYSAMRSAGPVRINRDFYPISYFYDMVLWSAYFNFKLSKFLLFFTRYRLIISSIIIYGVIFFLFFARRHNEHFKNDVTLLALATTGLSEISFEILIVLAFQIIYGYLYYKIGVIVTSFMLGLSLGSIYVTYRLPRITRPFHAYTILQGAVFLYPAILLILFRVFVKLQAHPSLSNLSANIFALLPLVAGFVGGVQYPLANKICATHGRPVGRVAGSTYAADLLGSFMGALFLSSFFIPVVGIYTTCILVMLLNLISLILLLIAARNNPLKDFP